MAEVGDRLGRYTLLKRLAVGGMGHVFVAAKAGPVGFGPYVALKVLRDELAVDQQFVDMLVDEANISMFLNHQNVVSVLDLAEDSGRYYLAMEYVQGITTERLIETLSKSQELLELPLSLYIASELCRALKYAHTRVNHAGEPLNIIHRDVTPANILLSVHGEVKLTDFGIARAKGRVHQTQAGVLKGKFGYMAPEMVRYERIDARADLFCAGVVIYLMLTGRHPVAGAAIMEAIQRFEDRAITPPSELNPDVTKPLSDLVMRCLEPKVEDRWYSAQELGDALQNLILDNPNWRRQAHDGATGIVAKILEIAPDAFDEPLVADELAKYLEQSSDIADLSDDYPAPGANLSGGVTVAPAGPMHPATDDLLAGETIAGPDRDTDESFDRDRVQQIHAELEEEANADSTSEYERVDTDEDKPGTDEDATSAYEAVSPPAPLEFKDPSTDRSHLRQEMMMEPALPAHVDKDAAVDLDDKTIASPGPNGADDPNATIVGMSAADLPMLATVSSSAADDEAPDDQDDHPSDDVDGADKTLLGMSKPDWDELRADKTAAGHLVGEQFPRWGEDEDERSETEAQEEFGAPTVLDGLSIDQVHEAMQSIEFGDSTAVDQAAMADTGNRPTITPSSDDLSAAPTLAPSGPTQRPPDPLPAVMPQAYVPDNEVSDPTLQASELDLDRIVADSVKTGAFNAAEEAPAKEAPKGVRIVLGDDGMPSVKEGTLPPEDRSSNRGAHERGRSPLSASAGSAPAQLAPLEIGSKTGRWMAGELDGDALDWSDEAAARRAVAARNQPPSGGSVAPSGGISPPAGIVAQAPPPAAYPRAEPPYPMHPDHQMGAEQSFLGRNLLPLLTLGVAVSLFLVLAYSYFFTNLFWPKLSISTVEPGAEVTVSEQRLHRTTPLQVKVEPDKVHLVRLELKGHHPAVREVSDLKRARSYTMPVDLRPTHVSLVLPSNGVVKVGGRPYVGRKVSVPLPTSGPFRSRIEADGYESRDFGIEKPESVTDAINVPMTKK